MTTFISLINWTDQGVRSFKETVEREANAAVGLATRMGGEIESIHLTVVRTTSLLGRLPGRRDRPRSCSHVVRRAISEARRFVAYTADQMSVIIGKIG